MPENIEVEVTCDNNVVNLCIKRKRYGIFNARKICSVGIWRAIKKDQIKLACGSVESQSIYILGSLVPNRVAVCRTKSP